jgi:hypothetical protein
MVHELRILAAVIDHRHLVEDHPRLVMSNILEEETRSQRMRVLNEQLTEIVP